MTDIAANLTDLLNKTIGVFTASLVGGFGLALGLRSAGWHPHPGTTMNFYNTKRPVSDQEAVSECPQRRGGNMNQERTWTRLDELMTAVKFDRELLTPQEIQIIEAAVREAIRTLCPLAFRITTTKELYAWCCNDHRKCGICWKGEHRRD